MRNRTRAGSEPPSRPRLPALRRRDVLAGLLATLPVAGQASAQAYPSRPVRLIIPFPPGNLADLTARLAAEEVQRRLGHGWVVDNRAGASGAIGIRAVMQAPPDGYTLLLSSLSPIVVNPVLTANPGYDPLADLAPILLMGWTGYLLVCSPDFPATTLAEAVRVLRAAPAGRYAMATPGTGTVTHLASEQFMLQTGTRMETVPYRGSGAALMDVASGRVALMIDAMSTSLPQARGSQVRALAVVQQRRSPLAPEIPAISELGVPEVAGMEVRAWTGLLGAAATPPEVVDYWNRELGKLLADPAVTQRFAAQNVEVAPPAPAAGFRAMIEAELARWRQVVRDARIEVQ
ncbi:Bug family tripartite tricarboxylate transporter substrate binding protein [Plastoroseomonas hellenica]|uniref:Tripartite tricarboxylate transporter substrate binding protein n=1 Tax=Plastoroseomonas hellenica TaxID=2687306 RepID=A0ABS5ES96_9PROT|nr:tripartite tricarboxylate transporter substrate binding protein [Plastoroseomonas hellenica]MBR0663153.1 tripartite tricarboxylate transporter substrate binding protein [Plastoroseomonas hellenica]